MILSTDDDPPTEDDLVVENAEAAAGNQLLPPQKRLQRMRNSDVWLFFEEIDGLCKCRLPPEDKYGKSLNRGKHHHLFLRKPGKGSTSNLQRHLFRYILLPLCASY